jgi:BMFP domain-containing protein YqiC
MLDLRMIDELTRKLGESLPPGVNQTKDELERRFRSVLTGAFERMNLVSREEFDARCKTLEETRAKLRALEEQLEQLQSG